MKKISILLIVVLSIVLSTTITFANNYQDYLQGNKNLILCGGHMWHGWYVDKSSLVVQKNNPPIYQIAVNVLSVPDIDKGNTTHFTVQTITYMYNWDERKMYKLGTNGQWNYIPPVGTMASTGHEFSGEMAFYIAFHKKFYGGQKWYSPEFKRYMNPNCGDTLYSKVDNAEKEQRKTYIDESVPLFENGQYESVIEKLNNAMAITSQTDKISLAQLYTLRGTAYSELGKYKEALSDLGQSLYLNPNDATTCSMLCYVHIRLKDYDSAENFLKRLKKLEPNHKHIKIFEEEIEKNR